MDTYRRWVVGFLFNTKGEVALVAKTRPAWQAGRLNGIGGKIEAEETPLQAMEREFMEEAGAKVLEWREFALLKVQDGQVHIFVAHGDYKLQSTTDEFVGWHKIANLSTLPVIENLAWLIPLALDAGNTYTTIEYFQAASVGGHA